MHTLKAVEMNILHDNIIQACTTHIHCSLCQLSLNSNQNSYCLSHPPFAHLLSATPLTTALHRDSLQFLLTAISIRLGCLLTASITSLMTEGYTVWLSSSPSSSTFCTYVDAGGKCVWVCSGQTYSQSVLMICILFVHIEQDGHRLGSEEQLLIEVSFKLMLGIKSVLSLGSHWHLGVGTRVSPVTTCDQLEFLLQQRCLERENCMTSPSRWN